MKITLVVIVSVFICLSSYGADNQRYKQIDKIAKRIPDSLTTTTSDIARYLTTNLNGEEELARGAFTWIASNITYDLDNLLSVNVYQDPGELINEVLTNKKGVCMHFAQLYHDITTKAGLESVIISGYTTLKGHGVYVPHSWCAVMIDSSWHLVDPVWGSGYIQKKSFYKQLDNFYFKSDPWKLIKTHMPYDPLWQLVFYPINNHDFHTGKTYINTKKPFLNYNDTISYYRGKSNIESLIASCRRIESNGITNPLILERVRHDKRMVEYYRYQKNMEDYAEAVDIFNTGVRLFKQYIEYRNKQFLPERPFVEIYEMLTSTEVCFVECRQKLDSILQPDSSTIESITSLEQSLEKAMLDVKELKGLLEEYKNAARL